MKNYITLAFMGVLAFPLLACDASSRTNSMDGSTADPTVYVNHIPLRFSEVLTHRIGSLAKEEQQHIARVGALIRDSAVRQLTLKQLADSNLSIIRFPNASVAAEIAAVYHIRALDHAAADLDLSRRWAQTHPTKVTIGLGRTLPSDVTAIVTRSPRIPGEAVIELRRTATVGDLALAFRVLWELRDRTGDFLSGDQHVEVRGTPFKVDSERSERYSRYLAAMQVGRAVDIASIHLSSAASLVLGHIRHPSKPGA